MNLSESSVVAIAPSAMMKNIEPDAQRGTMSIIFLHVPHEIPYVQPVWTMRQTVPSVRRARY